MHNTESNLIIKTCKQTIKTHMYTEISIKILKIERIKEVKYRKLISYIRKHNNTLRIYRTSVYIHSPTIKSIQTHKKTSHSIKTL